MRYLSFPISTPHEVDRLAHKIAFDAAAAIVDSYSFDVTEGEETWKDMSDAEPFGRCCLGEDGLQDELRYLELRGALIRHPEHPNWVQIGELDEA